MADHGPWVRFFASDWLAGTRGMTASETGIYITMIALMYERGGPIEYDAARLARYCGSSNSAFKTAIDHLVASEKLQLVDGYVSQNRVVEELSYSSNRRSVASHAAKSRHATNINKFNGRAPTRAMREQCASNAPGDANQNQKPEPEKEPPLPPQGEAEQVDAVEQDFAAFWRAYPRRVGKGPALKAYRRWRHAIPHGAIMSALDASIRAWRMERPPRPMDKTPHPASWLNSEPWHDEHTDPDSEHDPGGASDEDIAAEILADMQAGRSDADRRPPRNGRGDTLDLHAGADGRFGWGDGAGPRTAGEVH